MAQSSWLYIWYENYVMNYQNFFFKSCIVTFKGAATDMRYFSRNKFSSSLVHKKNFRLIWQVIFKAGYFFVKRGRIPLLSLNKLGKKSQTTIILGKFCKQVIIKLSLAYTFRKMFPISQILKHVHITYSFHELLIFFRLTLDI